MFFREIVFFFITLILKLVHCTAFVKIGGIAKFSGGEKMRKCLAIYNLIPEVDWIKQRAHNQRQSRDHAVSSIKKLKV